MLIFAGFPSVLPSPNWIWNLTQKQRETAVERTFKCRFCAKTSSCCEAAKELIRWLSAWRLGNLEQTGGSSAVHDLGATVRVELFGSILQVKLHGAFADENFMSDLLIAHSFGGGLDHFEFAIG